MNDLHVICRIADVDYAISANEVFQLETYTAATPVPGAPAYVLGLVQVRQQIIPLLDLRVRFGLAARKPDPDSRMIVLSIGTRLVALLVDSSREVQSIKPEEFKAAPDLISAQTAGFVKSIAHLKNRIVLLLDSEKVIGERMTNV